MTDESTNTQGGQAPDQNVVGKIEQLNAVLAQVRSMLESREDTSNLQSSIEKNISDEFNFKFDQFQIRLDALSEDIAQSSSHSVGDPELRNDVQMKLIELQDQFETSIEEIKAGLEERLNHNENQELIREELKSLSDQIHANQDPHYKEELQNQINVLQEQVDTNLNAFKENIEHKLNDTDQQTYLQSELLKLNEQIEANRDPELRQDLENKMSFLQEQVDANITDLKTNIESKLNESEAHDQLREELKHLVEQYRIVTSNDIQELTQNTEEIKNIQQNLFDDLQGRLNNLQSDINSTQVSMEHLRHQITEQETSLENSVAEIQRDSKDFKNQHDVEFERVSRVTPILEQQISSAHQDIQGVRDELQNQEQRSNQFENSITELQQILHTVREETGSFQHKMFEEFSGKNDNLAEQLHARTSGLETDIQREHEALKSMAQAKNEEMDGKLKAAKDHLLVIHDEIQELNNQVKTSQKDLGDIRIEHEQAAKEFKESRNDIRVIGNRFGEFRNTQKRLWVAAVVALLLVPTITIFTQSNAPVSEISSNDNLAQNNQQSKLQTLDQTPSHSDDTRIESNDGETFEDEGLLASDESDTSSIDSIRLDQEVEASESFVETGFSTSESEEIAVVVEEPQPNVTLYVVKGGDSLWTISKKFYKKGTMYKKILADNQMSSNELKPGKTLRIYH